MNFITEIVVFFERETEKFDPFQNGFEFLQNPKIKLHFLTHKPMKRSTFQNFIEYANKYYPKKHIVICNTDIFFYKDSQIERLTELQNHDEIWFLTRYFYKKDYSSWIITPFGWKKGANSQQEDIPDFKNWKTVTDLQEYKNLERNFNHTNQVTISLGMTYGSADSFCFYAPLAQTDFDIFFRKP